MRPKTFYLAVGGIILIIILVLVFGGSGGPLQPSPVEECKNQGLKHSLTNEAKEVECTSEAIGGCQEKIVTCSIDLTNLDIEEASFEISFNYLEDNSAIKTLTREESVKPQETKTFSTETTIRSQREIDCTATLTSLPTKTEC